MRVCVLMCIDSGWLWRKVTKFFGVADLTQSERERFADQWLVRAQKMHNDDVLLTLCRDRGQTFDERRTAAEHQRLSSAPGDVPDAA